MSEEKDFRKTVYQTGKKIKSFRRAGYFNSAEKLTDNLSSIVDAAEIEERQWITDVIFGMGHPISDLMDFINYEKNAL
tara:strand:+ start:91 stop:324 length:234 start_codon:yes stop_codon:yes gene_type:complete